MKISVVGAAGMVGTEITAEAKARGHEVATYTRSGSLEGSQALDVADTAALVDVINSSDVTVVTVAGRDDYEDVIRSHAALVEAAPTGRLVVIGGAGALSTGDSLLLDSPDFPEAYLPEAKAFAKVLDGYRNAEGLDWTVVAPSPLIAPGVRTGEYKTELDTPAGHFVSSQDFAVAVVDELENPQHRGRRFTVASADEAAAQADEAK